MKNNFKIKKVNKIHEDTKKKKNYLDNINSELRNVKMYLLNEFGPTSYLFKTDKKIKIKIDIGKINYCSNCCKIYNEFNCIHIIHCLIKVFNVENMNLLINRKLSVKEVENIITGKYNKLMVIPDIKKKSNLDKRKMDLKDQEICPICHDDLGEITCNCEWCGYNFHNECWIIFIKHKNDDNFKCPMCRGVWKSKPNHILSNLENKILNFKKEKLNHKKICVCKRLIIGNIFKCLQCLNKYFCIKCFKNKKYTDLHIYFMHKKYIDEKWSYLKITVLFNYKIIKLNYVNNYLEFFKIVIKNNQNNNNFRDIFITNQLFKNIKKCDNCKKEAVNDLNCSHSFCDNCLLSIIKKKKCIICKKIILNGFILKLLN